MEKITPQNIDEFFPKRLIVDLPTTSKPYKIPINADWFITQKIVDNKSSPKPFVIGATFIDPLTNKKTTVTNSYSQYQEALFTLTKVLQNIETQINSRTSRLKEICATLRQYTKGIPILPREYDNYINYWMDRGLTGSVIAIRLTKEQHVKKRYEIFTKNRRCPANLERPQSDTNPFNKHLNELHYTAPDNEDLRRYIISQNTSSDGVLPPNNQVYWYTNGTQSVGPLRGPTSSAAIAVTPPDQGINTEDPHWEAINFENEE